MENNTNKVEGYVLELYRADNEVPCYVCGFDLDAEAGFSGYSEDIATAVVFESREALLPLASIEVEAITVDQDEEFSVYDGFRILPFTGNPTTQFVSKIELESALEAFDQE